MTPTAHLLQTNWYRPGGRFDAAPIIVLRFNQPVKPEDVAAHVRAAFEQPRVPAAGHPARRRRRGCATIDPSAVQAFTDKVQRARAAAEATAPVLACAREGLGQEAVQAVCRHGGAAGDDAGAARQLGQARDRRPHSVAGRPRRLRPAADLHHPGRADVPGRPFSCDDGCDPDNGNPIEFRGRSRRTRSLPR